MVNDNPENMLLREVDQIRQSQKEMKKTLDMVNQQIAVNMTTRNQLKRDFENKDRAMNLDQTAFETIPTSYNMSCTCPRSGSVPQTALPTSGTSGSVSTKDSRYP